MTNYEEARNKLTNAQLNKFKSASKNKAGTTLSITETKSQGVELKHVIANNMSTDIKLSNVRSSK